jgi:hypothetical protein
VEQLVTFETGRIAPDRPFGPKWAICPACACLSGLARGKKPAQRGIAPGGMALAVQLPCDARKAKFMGEITSHVE